MKIRFKNKEVAIQENFHKEEYKVLAREKNLKGRYNYTLFNDDLKAIRVSENKVEITDPDMSDMVQRNDVSYEQEFYINEFFIQLIPLEQGQRINTDHIWMASKAFRYFEKYKYEIPDSYREKALNENYKMNLIEGYLVAVNHYMMVKFDGGCYYENFRFYKGKVVHEIILKKIDYLEELNIDGYRNVLMNFIEKGLYDKEPGEEKSKYLCQSLFSFIDALFIDDIEEMYSYCNSYDDCIVIKYQNEYYYLNYFWFG